MSFEIELLADRFDTSEEEVWRIISKFWMAYKLPSQMSAFAMRNFEITDIRQIQKTKGVYFDGIPLEINFIKDRDELILLGISHLGESPISRFEHILGVIEVKGVREKAPTPVDVRIVCQWEPFFWFFRDMAFSIKSAFMQQKIDVASNELLDFKKLVERQTYKDIFVNNKPQENIPRAYSQPCHKGR